MIGANKFARLTPVPKEPYYQLRDDFASDPHPNKVYIAIGEYRTNESTHYNFQVVQEVEKIIFSDPSITKEYLPIEGLDSFNVLARSLILGPDCPATRENRVATIESVSVAGALNLAAEFFKEILNPPCVYLSNPTWGGHYPMLQRAGCQLRTYPYWDKSRSGN